MTTQVSPDTLSNRMTTFTTAPLFALYWRIALPMALAMMVQGLYNLVDVFFIARYIGSDAVSAVALAFPVQMLQLAIGAMIGNGAATLVGRSLGAGRVSQAKQLAGSAAALAIISALLFTLVLLPALPWLFDTRTDDLGIPAQTYLRPIVSATLVVFGLSLVSDLLRTEGKTAAMMLIILVSALGNTVLDALFILIFELGLEGAAWATVITQLLALLTGIRCYLGQASVPAFNTLSCDGVIIRRVLALGSPLLFSYLGIAIVTGVINFTLSQPQPESGEQMLSAYGILSRVNIFIALPLIALANTAQTITAHNAGAGLSERVRQSIAIGFVMACGYLLLMALLMLSLPKPILGLFSDDMALIETGAAIASVIYIALPFAGISAIATATFQALDIAHHALLLSVAKIYLLLLPLLLILPAWCDLQGLWYAFAAADLLACALASQLLWRQRHRFSTTTIPSAKIASSQRTLKEIP